MKDTSPKVIAAIKEYQAQGACNDFDESNFEQNGIGVEWSSHVPGTMFFPGGTIFLGMPKGFNKATIQIPESKSQETIKISIFTDWAGFLSMYGGYNYFNVPVWKFLNENGHTFIRGVSPRVNKLFLHIILEDCMDKINCLEITKEMQDNMD